MISQEEEHAFRALMETMADEAREVEERVDNEKRLKLILSIITIVVGVAVLISAVAFSSLFVGITAFGLMFAGLYFLSTVVHI